MATLTRDQWQTEEPPPKQQDHRRAVGVLATLSGVVLAFPITLAAGLALGAAGWLWSGDGLYIRLGAVVGLVLFALIALSILAGSAIVWRIMAPPQPVSAPSAPQLTISYQPLSMHQDTRIIPLRSYDKTIDQVNVRDLAWFVAGLKTRGHSMRAWLGARTPSGAVVDADRWRSLCRPLRKSGVLVDVGPRRSGRLVTTDVDVILAQLGIEQDMDLWTRGEADDHARGF